MASRTKPKRCYIKIWVDADEIGKFAGRSLTHWELDTVLDKLPELIWGFVGDDGMETFVKGILEE